METITFRGKLEASYSDGMGYTNYVFRDLEFRDIDYQYIMCVRFPNWDQAAFSIGDEGFVTIRYVKEGEDKWFDGQNFNTYKYTNIIFMKFIPIKNKVSKPSSIILD